MTQNFRHIRVIVYFTSGCRSDQVPQVVSLVIINMLCGLHCIFNRTVTVKSEETLYKNNKVFLDI